MGVFKDSLKTNVVGLSLAGAYPIENISVPIYLLYSFLMEIVLMVPIILSPLAKYIVEKETNWRRICENAFLLTCISIIPFKTLVLLKRHKQVKAVIKFYDQKPTLQSSESDEMVNDTLKRIRLYSKIYIFYFEFTNCMLALKTLFDSERKLSLDLWLPYDYKTDTLSFVLTVLYLHIGKLTLFQCT